MKSIKEVSPSLPFFYLYECNVCFLGSSLNTQCPAGASPWKKDVEIASGVVSERGIVRLGLIYNSNIASGN